jgi:porin
MLKAMMMLAASAEAGGDAPWARHAHTHTHASGEINEAHGPILLEASYTGEVMSNLSGGVRRGERYLDNLDVVLEADLEQAIGWRGANLHVYGLYNNGKSVSELIGDAQAASNVETGTQAARLYEAWIDQKIGSNASIRAGLYDLNSEFDVLDTAGLFIGSAHGIGTDISQTGLNGPSIFPSTSLAARVDVTPAEGWAVRAAVLDGVPGNPNHPGRTTIRLGNGDGALLIGEAQAPVFGGKLLFGHWRYTARFDTHQGSRDRGNAGYYLRGEAPLVGRDGTLLSGFFRLGTAGGRFNMFDRFASAGFKLTGLVKGRDEDEIGLAFASAFTSRGYRLTNGGGKTETAVEFTYRAPVTDWLTLQPDVQYVRNPNADPAIDDALVVGLRFEISFRLIG